MSADLFGFESPLGPRTNDRPEAAARAEELKTLRQGRGEAQRVEAQRRHLLADLAMLMGVQLVLSAETEDNTAPAESLSKSEEHRIQ